MSTKYDKSIEISHEEEGTYRRREYSPVVLKTTKSSPGRVTSYEVAPARTTSTSLHKSANYTSDEDEDNYEQWTTSKRKVNHKTRQVETRVSRQLLVEDGKVIADSGPQVVTRIKEDNKVEECEKEKAPKNKAKFDSIKNAPDGGDSVSGRVLGEKKEIQRVTHEVREENMQYHDERFKELTGHDVHRRAIKAPHELITINDKTEHSSQRSAPRGKMVHYSNKGKKYRDTDEILEVAKLAIDGSVTKEVKRTRHHEEFSDTERPDEEGEAEALRRKPIAERSSRRGVDYVNDFDDVDGSDGGGGGSHRPAGGRRSGAKHSSGGGRRAEDEAFPRYQIDPLLNSLRDEDFKPPRRDDDDEPVRYTKIDHERSSRRPHSPAASGRRSQSPATAAGRVEVPEEYRVHRHRLMSGNTAAAPRERSFSPVATQSKLSSASSARRQRKEDASTQAHLTDEDERKSIRSSSSASSLSTSARRRQPKSQATHATHLQRQSNANSSRNYFYGANEAPSRRANKSRQSVASISRSSSSTSLDDPKEVARRQGTQSRDSGFKSPTAAKSRPRSASREIYSTSAKSAARRNEGGAISPTPSLGQRSVKTTTTTMAAGLADRPLSPSNSVRSAGGRRYEQDEQLQQPQRPKRVSSAAKNKSSAKHQNDAGDPLADRVSLCSLNPNATTIKVPYKRVIEVERNDSNDSSLLSYSDDEPLGAAGKKPLTQVRAIRSLSGSETMSLQDDIVSLSKRLDQIREAETPNRAAEKHDEQQHHFDYKTIIANVQPAMPVSRNQIVDSYSVQVIEHDSPFRRSRRQSASIDQVDDLSKSIAQKLQLNNLGESRGSNSVSGQSASNNNNDSNEINLNFNEYVKYKATPVLVDSELFNNSDDADRASTCSLQSARTYNIRTSERVCGGGGGGDDELAKLSGYSHKSTTSSCENLAAGGRCADQQDDQQPLAMFDEHKKGPAAWFYDAVDGSSTTIPAPARPETPKIDSKTEELAQARGGRSYYLELVEPTAKVPVKRPRPNSMDSLYSRWNSCNQLGAMPPTTNRNNATAVGQQVKRKQLVVSQTNNDSRKESTPAATEGVKKASDSNQLRRQLPSFDRLPPFGNRSKSSSCLLIPSTKPSKYSIYGGLRRPGEGTKPVPRLSYSRAIGPKSQRQLDAQPKTPSRYLKMR